MLENTFEYKSIEVEGGKYHLLTAQEYPWMNIQVITFAEADHDESIAKLHAQPTIGWVIEHPMRRDFAVIQAGGCTHPLHFNQENFQQVAEDMQQCLRNAAAWWADHSAKSNI